MVRAITYPIAIGPIASDMMMNWSVISFSYGQILPQSEQNVNRKFMENWRPILGWDGYEVSDLGRVRSWKWPSKGRQWIENREREPRLIVTGQERPEKYIRAQLSSRDRGVKKESVHVLVLEAFVGLRPSPDHQGSHWDGNRFNNRLSNLRWATRKENAEDKKRHGTYLSGDKIKNQYRR